MGNLSKVYWSTFSGYILGFGCNNSFVFSWTSRTNCALTSHFWNIQEQTNFKSIWELPIHRSVCGDGGCECYTAQRNRSKRSTNGSFPVHRLSTACPMTWQSFSTSPRKHVRWRHHWCVLMTSLLTSPPDEAGSITGCNSWHIFAPYILIFHADAAPVQTVPYIYLDTLNSLTNSYNDWQVGECMLPVIFPDTKMLWIIWIFYSE
jgi:hypothetical protein